MRKILLILSLLIFQLSVNSQTLKGLTIGKTQPSQLDEGIVCVNCKESKSDYLEEFMMAVLIASNMKPITVGGIAGKIYFTIDKNNKVNWIRFEAQESIKLTYDFIDDVNSFYNINIDYRGQSLSSQFLKNYCYKKNGIEYCVNLKGNTFVMKKIEINSRIDF